MKPKDDFQMILPIHKWLFVFLLIALFGGCKKPAPAPSVQTETLEIIGTDFSFYPEIQGSGLSFSNSKGEQEDMLLTLKKAGFNTIRLRIWNQPETPNSSFESVAQLAATCKAMGFKVWLTLHYSDTWADPGNQQKPKAWENLGQTELEDSVYAFTFKVVKAIAPAYVQIGNEINNGMLWPNGSLGNMGQLKSLINKGISATRSANSQTKIMLHCAGYKDAPWFFNQIGKLDYDIAALSYYPIWHGKSLDSLRQALIGLNQQLQKPTLIAETAYPFTLGWNDWTNNILGTNNQIIPAYPATPAGQKSFWNVVLQTSRASSQCLGVCYWGAEWVSYKGNTATNGSSWENQAFWDFERKALPILEGK